MAIFKSPTDRLPEGWIPVNTYGIYRKGNRLVVLGDATETHNCDAMGCGSLDHVSITAEIPDWLVIGLEADEKITDHREQCPECGSSEVFYFDVPETGQEGYECDNCCAVLYLSEMPKQQPLDGRAGDFLTQAAVEEAIGLED